MASNRIPHSSWRLLNAHLYTSPVRSVGWPGTYLTLNHARACLYGSATKEWTGSTGKAHTVNKVSKGDDSDPESETARESMRERDENYGISNHTKSHATTGRHGRTHERKAKKEHPKAPEPIIGMNDERAEKGH